LKSREYLESFAKKEGLEISNVDQDDGISGYTTGRPALRELLKDAKQKKLDLVLVYKIDTTPVDKPPPNPWHKYTLHPTLSIFPKIAHFKIDCNIGGYICFTTTYLTKHPKTH
jgi:hypothetical protein